MSTVYVVSWVQRPTEVYASEEEAMDSYSLRPTWEQRMVERKGKTVALDKAPLNAVWTEMAEEIRDGQA